MDITKKAASKGERRKQRKIAAALAAAAAPPKETTHNHISPQDAKIVEDVEEEIEEDVQRPSKRLKKDSPERSSPPPGFIPSFPAPTRPNPPSKSVLYLQGLDKPLVQAKVVASDRVLTLATPDHPDSLGLSNQTRKRLNELGIKELFAVQTAIIPFLLPQIEEERVVYSPYSSLQDVCVSAPTGSGKTLAYVLPIVETLSRRVVTRLRALIVLPTRDLVSQVRTTFEAFCKGRGLKIGIAIGQSSFSQEQTHLVNDTVDPLQGGSSKVDILICTPGRLMDHLNGTPNFSLQHLRFMVIDEADRLITQSFQDWLPQVLAATKAPPVGRETSSLGVPQGIGMPEGQDLPLVDSMAPDWLPQGSSLRSTLTTDLDEPMVSSCQKLLFSATLTRDPSKIAALNLRNPKYFLVQATVDRAADQAEESFAIPASLSENMIVCESIQKPLVLFHLIHSHNVTNALVFTKSADSTSRLVRLLELFEKARLSESSEESTHGKAVVARAYSSDLSPSERKNLLLQFKNEEVDLLICSDLISRGIDISHVSHVVSYDAPVDMRKYVHRVGRTARAGRSGDAWSLIEEQEARHFKQMLSAAGHIERVKKMRIKDVQLAPLQKSYETALRGLKDVYTHTS